MTDLVLVEFDHGDVIEFAPRGRAFARSHNLTVSDVPAINPDGTARGSFRVRKASGRPDKPKTTVAEAAEEKASRRGSAATQKEK